MARNRLYGVPATGEFSLPLPLHSDHNSKQSLYREGYSQHGDYVFGWKDDSLQRAMDGLCFGDVCDVLERQSDEDAMKCTIPQVVKDDIDGCKSCLPDGQRGYGGGLARLTTSQGSQIFRA